jgi:deazaflavin-dependent oxidoreductase (nitroreductase family)
LSRIRHTAVTPKFAVRQVGDGVINRTVHRADHRPEKVREHDMTETTDWNSKIIADFRANEGRVGGPFEGAPLVLVHHRGRKSGREYVNPVMYLPFDADDDIIYVFATKGGAPTNPDWYYNLTTAGEGSVERGTESYNVTVRQPTGPAPNATASTPNKPAATPASPTTSGKPLASEPSPCSSSRERRPRRPSHQSSAPSNRSS